MESAALLSIASREIVNLKIEPALPKLKLKIKGLLFSKQTLSFTNQFYCLQNFIRYY